MIELPVVGEVEENDVARRLAARRSAGQRGVYIQTLGCQMNEHDSETMYGMVEKLGYGRVDDITDADLILYNTCSVRENPERKVYGQVGMLKKLKKINSELIIGVAGCMPQQKTELKNLRDRLEHVDIIFGTHNIHRLPELLEQVRRTGHQVVEVWHEEGDIVEGLPVQRNGDLKAYVTIMYGCNEFCTYCIVPYVRGKERSRRPEDIVAEVERLAAEGYQEITLLGQNVNAYGNDIEGDVEFGRLLRQVNDVSGINRIRYTSPHPKYMTDAVISAMRDSEKVVEHVHLPVQAGSNRTLRRMGRRYTREDYFRLVEKFRREIPGIAITTDIIVGFPGETEEDFHETLDLVAEVEFDSAFMFIYSPRIGTPATRLKDQIPEAVKKDRIHRLIELQNEMSLKRNRELIGSVQEVMVDGEAKNDPLQVSGRARNNKLVTFAGLHERLYGKTVRVKISEAQTWSLQGELL